LEATQLNLTTGVIGGIAVVVGLLMCFSGKRFFKVFLSLVGFIAGVVGGLLAMAFVTPLMNFSNPDMVTWIVAGILGVVGALVCLYAWKIGVYLGAGLGGYSIMTYILSLKAGGVIENELGRHGAIAVGVGLAVIAAIFLEDIAIVIASAISGSLISMVGLDCYFNTGFRVQVWDIAIKQTTKMPDLSGHMYYMFAGTLALAVLGVVVQLLSPSKGFGRSG
jgi:hypothetical protein